jgi:hypothetical protein
MGCGASSTAIAPLQDQEDRGEIQQPRSVEVQAKNHVATDGKAQQPCHHAEDGARGEQAKSVAERSHAKSISSTRDGASGQVGGAATVLADVSPTGPGLETLRAQMDKGFNRRDEAYLREIFYKHKASDVAGISKAHLMSALADIGVSLSSGESEELFSTQDLNDNGSIDWSEFVAMAAWVSGVEKWVCICIHASWRIFSFHILKHVVLTFSFAP